MQEPLDLFDLDPPEAPRLTQAVLAAWRGCCRGPIPTFTERAGEGAPQPGAGELGRAGLVQDGVGEKPAADFIDISIIRERLIGAD